jgi:RimJ/RimL family protein N-acetyltransferase
MLELISPTEALRDAWRDAHEEWGPGLHEDGFGIGADDDVDTDPGFGAWIAALRSGPGEVWWIVEDGEVLGGIALRAADDPRIERHGHIGYGVRPSARGRGVATWALRAVIDRAAQIGIDPVIAVCLDDNDASIATLERAGGRLERVEDRGTATVRLYSLLSSRSPNEYAKATPSPIPIATNDQLSSDTDSAVPIATPRPSPSPQFGRTLCGATIRPASRRSSRHGGRGSARWSSSRSSR